MSDYKKPLPRIDGPNRPFWDGARAGRLVLQRCLDCGAWRFPASRSCPACRGEHAEWQQASGHGVLVSFCLFHKPYFEGFAEEVPYNVIQVRLEEGVQLFSNLIGVPNERIAIGMKLEAHFEKATEAVTLVKFAPAEAQS
jgi:uncharacterized OB-fold protein